MPLPIGSRLGPYEVLAPLGAGGMGEVYRARDTKLDRVVAIKILPELLAHDPERLARFEREAKTLAALNHPNIAIIHGFEDATRSTHSGHAAIQALVMELVEGPTLADRIAQGPVPLDEALAIAKQIADALEAAHNHGIIHRDLKPANIKLRPDGTVKVLDFGLAKALSADDSGTVAQPLSYSPTITSPVGMTGAGVILGTAAYMAPEQARGKPVDRRADIWAFGCVLYEMLTGRQAFEGAEVTDVLARIIEREPDFNALPRETPPAVRRLLTRCLQKDRKRRLADVADARLEIEDALLSPARDAPTDAARPVSLWRKAIIGVFVIIVALAAGFGGWILKPTAPRTITRFAITLAEGDRFAGSAVVALSPDGTRLAYIVNDGLYLRALDQLDAVLIAGGEGPASPRTPFFSPDSQWVGFWQAGQLKKISVSGGAPVSLCPLQGTPFGATWTANNTILVGRGVGGISRVSANGGPLEPIITLDAGRRAHGPQLLPDGRTVLFTLAQTANWDEAQIVVQSLDGGPPRAVITGGTDGRYLPTGHLVYVLRDTVLAVRFDTTSLSTIGGPVPLVEGVGRQGGGLSNVAQFAVSSAGTLAYAPSINLTAAPRALGWVDRQGREEAISAPPRLYRHPRIAPDGTRVALEIQDDDQNQDIWLWDFSRGILERVTSDPSPDRQPIWRPDGERIIFSSMRTGTSLLFWQPPHAAGTAEPIVEGRQQVIVAYTTSPDGRHLVFRGAKQGGSDLMFVDLGGRRDGPPRSSGVGEPKELVQTEFEELNAEISPDGRWMAFQSNRSGVFEVYVKPFPDVNDGEWRVSAAGGGEPLWARDGKELFYRAPKGAVMRVSIAAGATWTASTPTQLFDASWAVASGAAGPFWSRMYDVSPDGKRFLMIKNVDAPGQRPTAPRIVIVQNWFEELKARVPTK
jgi:serine/threonine-protein kinase